MWRRTVPTVVRAVRRAPVRAVHASAVLGARTPRSSSLRARESELQQEIAQLERELQFVEKQEQVARLTAHLPPVDDALLEAIYRDLLEAPKAPEMKRLPDPTPRALERLALRLGMHAELDVQDAPMDAAADVGSEAPRSVDSPGSVAEEAVAGVGDDTERPAERDVPTDARTDAPDVPGDMAARAERHVAERAERAARRAEMLERLRAYVADDVDRDVETVLEVDASAAAPAKHDDALLPDVPADEWAALAVSSARDGDLEQTLATLDLMASSGSAPAPTLYAHVLNAFANRGAIDACVALSARMEERGIVAGAPMKHAMVKAYVYGDELYSALQYLQAWETSEPAPVSAYTVLMEHLLKHPVRGLHCLAWSLFYHMRLVAHPVPDAAAFALMIRACAAGVPQPGARVRGAPEADAERALDLFREMTTRHAIRPNKEVYDSLILTCARRKEHYGDAVRLVRELLDQSSEILAPETKRAMWADTYTFNALLQGSARTGDLRTARWVLAEMLRATYDGDVHCCVNEETMANVFWAYATYVPPLRSDQLRTAQVEGGAKGTEGVKAAAAPGAAAADAAPIDGSAPAPPADADAADAADAELAPSTSVADAASEPAEYDRPPMFTHAMPQTAQEVLGEARALLARILADQRAPDASLADHPLHTVHVTPRLLNAFLAVLTHHLPAEQQLRALVDAVEGADGVFAHAGVAPNGHTHALVLEACAASRARSEADSVADRVWVRYEALVAEVPNAPSAGTDAKTLAKMWALYIRNKAKSFEIDAALELLRTFYARYPPRPRGTERTARDDERAPPRPAPSVDLMPVPPPRATLDLLASVHGMHASAPNYPPLAPARPTLRFRELELLHHRCVALRRTDGVRLITHVDRAYTHAT